MSTVLGIIQPDAHGSRDGVVATPDKILYLVFGQLFLALVRDLPGLVSGNDLDHVALLAQLDPGLVGKFLNFVELCGHARRLALVEARRPPLLHGVGEGEPPLAAQGGHHGIQGRPRLFLVGRAVFVLRSDGVQRHHETNTQARRNASRRGLLPVHETLLSCGDPSWLA